MPNLPATATEVYLDIEGIPDQNSYYLIGIIIKNNTNQTEYSFWADNQDEQNIIFTKLIDVLRPLDNVIIYHYGSYEIRALRRVLSLLPSEKHSDINWIISNCYSLLTVFGQAIYPPTYTNGIKDIGRYLQFKWTEEDADGLKSLIWRYQWEQSKDEDIKNKLIRYNLEDCKALIAVRQWLNGLSISDHDKFANPVDFKRYSYNRWGKINFVVDEFDQINRLAYFNYQRDKILIKTNLKIRKKRIVRNKSMSFAANSIIDHPPPHKCPVCGFAKIYRHANKYRNVIDLKISQTGVKRWLVTYRNARYRCSACISVFTPTESFAISSKYGITLCRWIINQIMTYRISYHLICDQLSESFNIELSSTQILKIKSQFALYYKPTFEEIKTAILSSPVIHIDETQFQVRNEPGYIWVFTSIDAVFYLFKDSREASFLKDLLKNFDGVLVSDFYAGYDSINCRKQRCLIHLIRDLNDALLKNQFNLELKFIISQFSKILSNIMLTINRFGLKKRNLRKHKKLVKQFFEGLYKMELDTEVSLKWQKRLLCHKEELFTFLDFDGIPWNNNNAEAAIKAVAIYRRENDGFPTKKGIQDYLTLLSIHQTCKYRNLKFFDFLQKGENGIDAIRQ